MLQEALKSRKTHVLLAVAALYVAWQIWLTLAAPGKVVDFPAGGEKVNILVTSAVPAGAVSCPAAADLRQGLRDTR